MARDAVADISSSSSVPPAAPRRSTRESIPVIRKQDSVPEPYEESKESRACKLRAAADNRATCLNGEQEHSAGKAKREIGAGIFERSDVKNLLSRIENNDRDYTIVLKVKDQVSSDVGTLVMDEIIRALHRNTVCQAAYVQNLGSAIQDEQMKALIKLLKRKCIWALNIGETYHVTTGMWKTFCDALPETSVTHLYVSEHTISLSLKNKMRDAIRGNRKKHSKHCNVRNMPVIERVTNMWWNPINTIRHRVEARLAAKEAEKEERRLERERLNNPQAYKRSRSAKPGEEEEDLTKDPTHNSFWAEGFGDGGDVAWRFECSCLEVCSSYENWRFHPTGRQFQCTSCSKWAHVNCVLGAATTDEMMEAMAEVQCHKCKGSSRRERAHRVREEMLKAQEELLKAQENQTRVDEADEMVWAGKGGSAMGAFDSLGDDDDSNDNNNDNKEDMEQSED